MKQHKTKWARLIRFHWVSARFFSLSLGPVLTCLRNLGLTWMLLAVGGRGLMGQAGSRELTRTSSAYIFFGGNTSSHVERSLNRLFLVFSSTCGTRHRSLVRRRRLKQLKSTLPTSLQKCQSYSVTSRKQLGRLDFRFIFPQRLQLHFKVNLVSWLWKGTFNKKQKIKVAKKAGYFIILQINIDFKLQEKARFPQI